VTVTSADLSQWAAHRRAVVFTVSRRVPGIDPELAASRGLELLCVELIKRGDVTDPVTFWSNAAVEVALEMAQEEPSAAGEDARAEVMTAPVRRALDFEVLSTAMERLPAGEQRILWDHHVGSRPVAAIADEIGVLPYAAKRRLRRAENRLADSLAETHSGVADDVECRTTRASMHDFVRHRLLPRRRQQVEDHMVQCAGCTRAFVDVRESYWMLRAAAPVLLLGAAATAKTGTAVAAAATGAAGAGAAATGAGIGGSLAALGTRAVLTVRSALTDPVSLTATVAGGLFVTTAVTAGVAGDADAVSTFLESGTVSVSTQDPAKAATRTTTPASPKEDPTNLPGPTAFTSSDSAGTGGTPPGLAKKNGVPPGLAAKGGVPPGQAKKDGGSADSSGSGTSVPPGQSATDGTPPGLAKKDGVPPGQAKKDKTPPGQAKKDTPPGQAKKETTPPGQAKKEDGPPGQAKKDDAPPGQAKKKDAPPGQAKKDQEDSEGPGRSGQARSRRTSTS
jgi:hypothetical protein